jgi:hypothetical protein
MFGYICTVRTCLHHALRAGFDRRLIQPRRLRLKSR